ncbi:uncharacterized protein [Ptychodera flava]|uniref:uncharacterized protein n=1 Tax=Ptychodera flava TaxID=63121 RepID=UPI00396A6BD1
MAASILDKFVERDNSMLDPAMVDVELDYVSKEECAYACLQRDSLPCASFSYVDDGLCRLYEVLAEDDEVSLQVNEQSTHYDRKVDCTGGIRRGAKCYFVLSRGMPKLDAEVACLQDYDAELVNLHEVEEFDWLATQLDGDKKYWVALKDTSGRGKYFWADMEPLSYTDRWTPGDPDAQTGNCVTLASSTSKLTSEDCSASYGAVCERIEHVEAPFTTTQNTYIEFTADVTHFVGTEEECRPRCLNEVSFFCRSFLFDGNICELSNLTAVTSTPSFHFKKTYSERIVCPMSCSNGGTMDLLSCRCLCPVGWGGVTCERSNACFSPLGMENHGIPDGRITQSSIADGNAENQGQYGRLNDRRTPSEGWLGDQAENSTWLQVDLGELSVVTGIGTQSRGDTSTEKRSTSYQVQYSYDGSNFITYAEDGSEMEFIGNYADNILVVHELSTVFVSRFVRIVITGGDPALRLEIYGCPSNNLAKGKSATQSAGSNAAGIASKAVDDALPFSGLSDVCATTGTDANPWWIVDIGERYELIAVAVVKSLDLGVTSLVGTEIRIGLNSVSTFTENQLCGTIASHDMAGGSDVLKHCGDVIEGQYVSLQLTSGTPLSVCEVLVYANTHPCGPAGISHNSRCYAFYENAEEVRSFAEAMTFCYAERWGSLLDIQSLDEFEWISYNTGKGNSSYLIGLNYHETSLSFLWTDGSELIYHDKWDDANQPLNSASKKCVVMTTKSDGSAVYTTFDCFERERFVCEYAPGEYNPITQMTPLMTIKESLIALGNSLGIDSCRYALQLVESKFNHPSQVLTVEDLLEVLEIIHIVMDFAAKDENSTKNVMSIVNNILGTENLQVCRYAMEIHPNLISDFLSLMENFAELVAEYQQTEPHAMEYIYPNIVMYAYKLPSSHEGNVSCSFDILGRDIHIHVPHGAFQSLDATFNAIAYPTLSAIMPPVSDLPTNDDQTYIGSDVLSASLRALDGQVALSDENQLVMTFSHNKTGDYAGKCSFWRMDVNRQYGGVWSHDGCVTVDGASDENITKCLCNHMTSFAVLMQVVEFQNDHISLLTYISYIGGVTSIICLILTLASYGILKLYSSQRIIIHANLALALLVALSMTLFGLEEHGPGLCKTVAIIIHYSWMAVFVWMMVEGILLYVKTNAAFSKGVRTSIFTTIGWGVPLIVVGVTLAVQYDVYEDKKTCWLSIGSGSIWAFVGPALFVIVAIGVFINEDKDSQLARVE